MGTGKTKYDVWWCIQQDIWKVRETQGLNCREDEQDIGTNTSLRLSVDGIIGLAKNSKHESYAEYLMRRKLISSNTLTIENNADVLDSNYYKFTFVIFNKTALNPNLN